MNRKTLSLFLTLGLILLLAFACKNVEVPKSDCKVVTGVVNDISEGGSEDVVFELEGKQNTFYINRGVAYGFEIHALEKQLLAEEVTIYYADEWSPFAPLGSKSKHIREIRSGNWIVYSEFE